MFLYLLLLALASSSSAKDSQGGWNPSCTFNSSHFAEGVFYLEANATKLLYPNTPEGITIDGKTPILRIVCPGGKIKTSRDTTKFSMAGVRCIAQTTVKLDTGYIYAQFNELKCTKELQPTIQLTGDKTPAGKSLAKIGYKISVLEFISVVDQIAVDTFAGGYIPRWAHHKSLPIKDTDVPASVKTVFKKSTLSPTINFDSSYNLKSQRTKLLALYNDSALVDKYLPANGKHTFVPSPLIRLQDLYFPVEYSASMFYENTVPVWKSVEEGNWKRVNEIVRNLPTSMLASDLEVWTGTYLSLYLPNAEGKNVYVQLKHGLRPAQFLFKYFYDEVNNKGFVFITLNNPHLTELDKSNTLCERLPICDTEYPELADFSKGYTYCCSLKDFKSQAEKLGIPVFEKAATY